MVLIMKKIIISIPIFLCAGFCLASDYTSKNNFGSDSVENDDLTQPDGFDYDEKKFEPVLSKDELAVDLKDPSSVRCQIEDIFTLSAVKNEIDRDVLLFPVLCIGTGRDQRYMPSYHAYQTIVRTNDIAIDRNRKIKPNYVEKDAFRISHVNIPQPFGNFGVVFFSHVGNEGFPLYLGEELEQSLVTYRNFLKCGGFFIYNSEVHRKEFVDTLLRRHECDNFAQLADKWRQLMMQAGFVDVEVMIKDESLKYLPDMISFLIIAKTPLEKSA